MRNFKRSLYGLPWMEFYRGLRTKRLANAYRKHIDGFEFAGSERCFWPDWERKERDEILSRLAYTDLFIDIGANQGFYTCLAAANGLPVISIEPEIGNLRFLYSNLDKNGFSNVEVFPIAISNRPGVLCLFGDGDMASAIEGWQGVSSHFRQKVACNTLDNLFAARWANRSLLIKADVEGAEMALIEGSSALLARSVKPVWLIESFTYRADQQRTRNKNFCRLFEIMDVAGYECLHIDTGQCFTSSAAGEMSKTDNGGNFLFTPK